MIIYNNKQELSGGLLSEELIVKITSLNLSIL